MERGRMGEDSIVLLFAMLFGVYRKIALTGEHVAATSESSVSSAKFCQDRDHGTLHAPAYFHHQFLPNTAKSAELVRAR